jgi:hypothetical protein
LKRNERFKKAVSRRITSCTMSFDAFDIQEKPKVKIHKWTRDASKVIYGARRRPSSGTFGWAGCVRGMDIAPLAFSTKAKLSRKKHDKTHASFPQRGPKGARGKLLPTSPSLQNDGRKGGVTSWARRAKVWRATSVSATSLVRSWARSSQI